MNKMNIKTGDTVQIMMGRKGRYKDFGKKGKVLAVDAEKQRVVVEGLHLVTRHKKPTKQGEEGGRIKLEGSIHVSNVMLVCPHCGKATRVGHEIDGDKKYRVCRNAGCGKRI